MNSWEQFCLGFKDFFNQPLSVILGTIFGVGAMFLMVFAKTSWGKKAFNKLKTQLLVAENKLDESKNELAKANENLKNLKETKEQEINELKQAYEVKLYAYKDKLVNLETLCLELAKNSHNVKVENAVKDYLSIKQDLSNLNVSEIIENAKQEAKEEIKNQYDEKLDNLMLAIDELSKSNEELKAKIEELEKCESESE